MTKTTAQALRIHPKDDIIVALQNLEAGETVTVADKTYTVLETISVKHKFAAVDFKVGDKLTQYGITVGEVVAPIKKGAAITVNNVRHSSQAYEVKDNQYQWDAPDKSPWQNEGFQGFKRQDGQVGTANYWLVVPMVFCQNRNIDVMRRAIHDALGYNTDSHYIDLARNLVSQYQPDDQETVNVAVKDNRNDNARLFPNVDGVKFITHSLGCGGTRDDALALCRLLAGYIHHPNVAGATVLSLGCQNAEMTLLQDELADLDPQGHTPVLWFEQQDYGNERRMLDAAISQTLEGVANANHCQRETMPLSHLKIGVECGGSDGFSGLTANPLIGWVADHVVALGGSAILSEFPELCGVEQNILDRCSNADLRDRFKTLMQAYEKHAKAVGASFDMNPSPGNIRDGLITDAMKSAGAALKGGSSPVTGVLDYTQVVKNSGLNLLCTPGNDVESTTALAASGANLILFSTGLGTPTGNPVVPVLKISSNTTTALKMSDIIDFDAGSIVSDAASLDEVGAKLLDMCIQTASGDYVSKAVALGQDDFIPWKRGVSL